MRGLVKSWAPLVWLAPGERFMPLGVPEFLEHVQAGDNYLRTRTDVATLLRNESSFLYGKQPAGKVPIYALVKNCGETDASSNSIERTKRRREILSAELYQSLQTNELPSSIKKTISKMTTAMPEPNNDDGKLINDDSRLRKKRVHFHVTYWMFYPFSEGKAVCVLDLGFLGTWPIPTVGGVCLGRLKEYGSHVGDWEHMSLYFKGDDHPVAMYVSAHDAGAFYRYDLRTGTFVYESQETRKGIFQKPIFPEHVFTSAGSHPVLFSAKGSHGLWTAPGKHKFVRLPRLYDESGFGIAWPTWKKLEMLPDDEVGGTPAWMSFRGKWGNPRSNCHPLVRLGFNICAFVDGPTGIPTKKGRFQC
ncbi:uncharacterized protein [Fopius arisanus]|uniref:Uncharacterized protein isoform X2 n=1 Tax=Fopius arisanus TaxID=64838 RepID=A0A9R1U8A8_9HYME|nr:PREDICTED: uncharacterized protein LOC105272222 isoform X2 [Fopius arisanus]